MKTQVLIFLVSVTLLPVGCGTIQSTGSSNRPDLLRATPCGERTGPDLAAPKPPATCKELKPSEAPPQPGEDQTSVKTAPALPPIWYWQERQSQQTDRVLQQQWNYYYQNRTPAPNFQRPLTCHSVQMGGQIFTNCY